MAKFKDINLLEAMTDAGRAGTRGRVKWVLIAVVVVAALAAFAAFLYLSTVNDYNNRIDNLERQIASPTLLAAYQESLDLQANSTSAQTKASSITSTLKELSSYPQLYSKQVNKIQNYAGSLIDLVNIKYDSATGVLSFTAYCENTSRVPVFIERLRGSGIFADIQYRGYARNDSTGDLAPLNTTTDTTDDAAALDNADSANTTNSGAQAQTTASYVYQYDVQCLVTAPAIKLPEVASLNGGE